MTTIGDKQFLKSEAERLLSEPLLVNAIDDLRTATVQKLTYCDQEEREEYIATLRVIDDFLNTLRSHILDAKAKDRATYA